MSWNYRVVRHRNDTGGDGEDFLEIHEVYYGGSGNEPVNITERGASVGSESVEGLREVLGMMGEALNKPILDYGDFKPTNIRGQSL